MKTETIDVLWLESERLFHFSERLLRWDYDSPLLTLEKATRRAYKNTHQRKYIIFFGHRKIVIALFYVETCSLHKARTRQNNWQNIMVIAIKILLQNVGGFCLKYYPWVTTDGYTWFIASSLIYLSFWHCHWSPWHIHYQIHQAQYLLRDQILFYIYTCSSLSDLGQILTIKIIGGDTVRITISFLSDTSIDLIFLPSRMIRPTQPSSEETTSSQIDYFTIL